MSESNDNGNVAGVSTPGWEVEIPIEELDRSCQAPIMLMLWKAAGWLFLGACFALLNSVRFHAPDLLAHCPWLSYGRIAPAASVAFVYGFALQAALAVALWLIVRLGKRTLAEPGYALLGAGFWNLGVLIGFVGILAGDNTGYALFELPKYAVPILYVAYLVLAGLGLTTFLRRQVRELYVSQWFLLAALVWFPWILATASLLLQHFPVRGVTQIAIAGWYATGLSNIVLGGIALATIFYLIPKLLKRPLHSEGMAIFAFWLFIFFGSGAGVLSGSTVPAWVSSLSAVFAFFTCLAGVLVGLNLFHTIGGDWNKLLGSDLRFVSLGTVAFIASVILGALNAHSSIAEITQFTLVLPALQQLALGGFVMMTLIGGAYYLLQNIGGSEEGNGLVGLHFWVALVGVGLTVAVLGLGGLIQGQTMADASIPFNAVTKSALNFLRMETVGSLFLFAGSVLFLVNVGRIGLKTLCCCPCGWLSVGGDVTDEYESEEDGEDGEDEEDSDSVASSETKKAAKKVTRKKVASKKKAASKKKSAKKAAKK